MKNKIKTRLIKWWGNMRQMGSGLKEAESSGRGAEKILRETEQWLSQIINFLPDATFAIDKGGKVIVWNRAIEDMTGVKASDIIGKSDYEYSLPFYGIRRPILIDLVLVSNEEIERKYRFVKKEGGVLLAEANVPVRGINKVLWGKASPLYDNEGNIVGAIESIRDITARKQAEIALQESEERFRTLVENASDIIFKTDSTGHFTFFNPVALRLSGFTQEELLGKNYLTLIRPDMRDEAAKWFGRQFVKKIENTYFEYPFITKSGQEIWIGQNTQLMLEKGNVVGFQAVARDVTERKQVEEALRENEKLYKTLAESSFAAVFIVQDGKFEFINTSAIAYAGYTAEELIGQRSDKIVHPDDRELVRIKNKEMLAGKSNQAFEFRMITKQNQIRWISQTVTPINYRGRWAILGNAMDITDHRQMEVEREKLIVELRDALAKIKTLSGLLPICVSCKKIRDDKGYWEQLEVYIRDRSEAEFSHGLCPECLKKTILNFF